MSASRVAVLALVSLALFFASFPSRGQTNPAAAIAEITTPVAPSDLPKGASDVVKLFQMGKKDNVLIFYANFSGLDFHLNPTHVLYLKAVGISGGVINAMLAVDKERQKAVAVRQDDDWYYRPTVPQGLKAEPAATASTQEGSATRDSEMPNIHSVIYPDYSAFPSYYQSFDNSDHRHVTVVIGVGVGAGFGWGGSGYRGGYYGRGYFGGRR